MTKRINKISELSNSEASELNHAELPSSAVELGSFAARLKSVIGNQSTRSFAAACDLSDGVVRQYTAGKSEPGLAALIKIANVANVNINWLSTGEGDKRKEPYGEFIAQALQNRGKVREFRLKWKIVMECFNKINIENILNNTNIADVINITNSFNADNKTDFNNIDVGKWCKEVWLYSENFHDWYKNNYYPYRRGDIRKDHPLAWLINNAGRELGPQQGSMEYLLDAERRAEVDQSIKQFGCFPLDQGLLKRSLEGAYEWVETEGLKPDADMIFKIMMYRYNLVATIKFGALADENKEE